MHWVGSILSLCNPPLVGRTQSAKLVKSLSQLKDKSSGQA